MSQAAASPTDEAVAAALRWLSQDDHAAKHNQILLERMPGISEDLVRSAQFRQWLNGEQQVLLCLGGRGTGKTIATSMVVDKLFENFGAYLNIGIAFVYPGPTQEDRNPEKLLRSMLLQLGQRSPSVRPTLVDFHYRSNNDTSPPSTQDLLDALENTISKISKAYLVIGSLDDLSSADRDELLPGLQRLQTRLQINLLATSSTGSDDFRQFDRSSTLDISDTVAEYDLDAYLRRRFSDLPLISRSGTSIQMGDYRNDVKEGTKGM
jgi:Cdc6-like AAA superfamily ATPase